MKRVIMAASLLTAALVVPLLILTPTSARAQVKPPNKLTESEMTALRRFCGNLPAVINDGTTFPQFGDAMTGCGSLPAENAPTLPSTRQQSVDAACSRTAGTYAPVAINPKPCPLLGETAAAIYCGTHPANVVAVGDASKTEVHWCPVKFSKNSPPGETRLFGILLKLSSRIAQKKQADEQAHF
jgi:hypothetical protein